MSRDFKEEYTEYMDRQTPDLWARIEAGLPAKKSRRHVPRRYLSFGLTAAAALFIGICVIPLYLGGVRDGRSEASDGGNKSKSGDRFWEASDSANAGGGDGGAEYPAGDSLMDGEDGAADMEMDDSADDAADALPENAEPDIEEKDMQKNNMQAQTPIQETSGEAQQEMEKANAERDNTDTDDISEMPREVLLQVTILGNSVDEENGWIRYQAVADEMDGPIELILSGDRKAQIETELQAGQNYLISAYRQGEAYMILSVGPE